MAIGLRPPLPLPLGRADSAPPTIIGLRAPLPLTVGRAGSVVRAGRLFPMPWGTLSRLGVGTAPATSVGWYRHYYAVADRSLGMYKNQSGQSIELIAVDSATGRPKLGDAANLTAYVSKDDGAVTALANTSVTEKSSANDPGTYVWGLSQGETNANKLRFSGKSSTSGVDVIAKTLWTLPANFSARAIDSLGSGAANVTEWDSDPVPPTNVAGVPIVDEGYLGGEAAGPWSGTCQDGATVNTVRLDAGTPSVNGLYGRRYLYIQKGKGVGLGNILKPDFAGTTDKSCGVYIPWPSDQIPDSTSKYIIGELALVDLFLWQGQTPAALAGNQVQAQSTFAEGLVFDANIMNVLGQPLGEGTTTGDLAAAWSSILYVNGVPKPGAGVVDDGINRNAFGTSTGWRSARSGVLTVTSGTHAGNEVVGGVSVGFLFLEDAADDISLLQPGQRLQITAGTGSGQDGRTVVSSTWNAGGGTNLKLKLYLDRPWGQIPNGSISYVLTSSGHNPLFTVNKSQLPAGSFGATVFTNLDAQVSTAGGTLGAGGLDNIIVAGSGLTNVTLAAGAPVNARQALCLVVAMAAGHTSGMVPEQAGTTLVKDASDATVTRVSASQDGNSNRTSTTLTVPS